MEITFDFAKINQDVKKVIVSPSTFFSKNTGQSWKETLSYFIVLSAVGLVLNLLYLIFLYPLIIQYFPQFAPEVESDISFMNLAPYALYSFILGIVFSFFWGGALFAWLKIFKIEDDFSKAYKIVTYSRTLVYLLSWFPFLNIVIWFHSLYLLKNGIMAVYKTSSKTANTIVFTGVIAVFVVSSILVFLLQSF